MPWLREAGLAGIEAGLGSVWGRWEGGGEGREVLGKEGKEAAGLICK